MNTHQLYAIRKKGMPKMYVTRALQNVGKKGLPVMIDIHGGGGTKGTAFSNFYKDSNATWDNELVVVSVEYALAPEHKMP